jgi:hypothetical protein
MTFMPQTLSSDTPRLRCRQDEFAPPRAAVISDRRASSILSHVLAHIFPARSTAQRAFGVGQVEASGDLFSFYLERGIALYELGHYHTAATNFRMALRLNWRDEQTTAWIARADGACTKVDKAPRFDVVAVST